MLENDLISYTYSTNWIKGSGRIYNDSNSTNIVTAAKRIMLGHLLYTRGVKPMYTTFYMDSIKWKRDSKHDLLRYTSGKRVGARGIEVAAYICYQQD
jgi:hypothetical protein